MDDFLTINGIKYQRVPEPEPRQDIRDYCREHRVWAAKDEALSCWFFYNVKPEKRVSNWIKSGSDSKMYYSELSLNKDKFIFPDVPWDKSLVAPDGSMPLLSQRVKGFQVGHWYVNVGDNKDIDLDFDNKRSLADGKPHQCTRLDGASQPGCQGPAFDGGATCTWNPKDWIEVDPPLSSSEPKPELPKGKRVRFLTDGRYSSLFTKSLNNYFGIEDEKNSDRLSYIWIIDKETNKPVYKRAILFTSSEFAYETEPKPKAKELRRGDPIFVWNDDFDEKCPCVVRYFYSALDNGKVATFDTKWFGEPSLIYGHYRPFSGELLGVPRKDWPQEDSTNE